jgi:hypothetical protein
MMRMIQKLTMMMVKRFKDDDKIRIRIIEKRKSGWLGWHEDYTRAAGPITCKTLAGSHRYGDKD